MESCRQMFEGFRAGSDGTGRIAKNRAARRLAVRAAIGEEGDRGKPRLRQRPQKRRSAIDCNRRRPLGSSLARLCGQERLSSRLLGKSGSRRRPSEQKAGLHALPAPLRISASTFRQVAGRSSGGQSHIGRAKVGDLAYKGSRETSN